MMPRHSIASARSMCRRPANYICEWAVGLNEIEICRGEIGEWISQVTNQRDCLQKHFG